MLKIVRSSATSLLVSLLSAVLLVLFVRADALSADKPAKVSGKAVFEEKCLKCHKPSKFTSQHHDRREWEQILSRMELNTCELTPTEASAVADYLVKEHGD
jgi:cytochrome c5